ncbi:DUF4287 domain-containing protein [Streptomyces sp. NPDC052109]|uniref:DUF4287 domain-containing protein n=1 Tax=Streptomyces sp. NPDC052109 TaxID=3155527 RepID=UPI00341A90B2
MAEKTVQGPARWFPSFGKKYGRAIAEWQGLVRSSPPTTHRELTGRLRSGRGLGPGHADALVAAPLAEDK